MTNHSQIIELITAGKFDAAETCCHQYLENHSADAVAHNILGGLLSRRKEINAALASLSKAIALDPKLAKAHHNIGCIHANLGNDEQAIQAFRSALAADNTFAPSHYQLGLLLKYQGDFQAARYHLEQATAAIPNLDSIFALAEAIKESGEIAHAKALLDNYRTTFAGNADFHFRLASFYLDLRELSNAEQDFRISTELDPENSLALNNLGVSILKQYRPIEAAQIFRKAISLAPDEPNFHFNLGMALTDIGEVDEAINLLQTALSRWPDRIIGLTNLGLALVVGRKPQQALTPLLRARDLAPDDYETYNNLGVAYEAMKELEQAASYYQQSIALQPNFARPYNNLGNIALAETDLDGAIRYYNQALALDPTLPDPKMNLGLVHLLRGEFIEGWQGFEWRQATVTEKEKAKSFTQPQWAGEALNNQRILLHAEQGFGDTLQFVRYAPLVKARGGQVILQCQSPLKSILSSATGIDVLVGEDETLPPFDVHLPMLSLPYIFKTQIDTIPSQIPYLSAPAQATSSWRERLASEQRFRVGLVWGGSPTHGNNRNRSCPLKHFLALTELPDAAFYSLQKGLPAAELYQLPEQEQQRIRDFTNELHDFSDTAALLFNFDLVITVDTAVAHLAGALDVPTWILLPKSPDWRWLMERNDTPWYPRTRLFRQENAGDWTALFRQVKVALSQATK